MRKYLVALVAALAFFACGMQGGAPEGPARLISAWTYEPDREWLGGFSGLDTPNGLRFAMISDSGYFVVGRFRRKDGRIAGFDRFRVHTHKRPPIGEREGDRDAEGLVWTDGGFFVSREAVHEVWHFERPDAVPTILPSHPDFAQFGKNASLEALALSPEGELITLPERPSNGRFQLYRFGGDAWRQSATIPASDGFRAVGADFGPDGWLYLLERRFSLPFSFSSRVRRFRLDGDDILAQETLLVTPRGMHDNLEGIAVWRDPAGELRLTTVSDDNYLALQRTEFVEYRVPPALEPEAASR